MFLLQSFEGVSLWHTVVHGRLTSAPAPLTYSSLSVTLYFDPCIWGLVAYTSVKHLRGAFLQGREKAVATLRTDPALMKSVKEATMNELHESPELLAAGEVRWAEHFRRAAHVVLCAVLCC